MEKVDRELLFQIAPTNPQLQTLYEEHVELERQLDAYKESLSYSPMDDIRRRELKKQKLKGMDCIMAILAQYKNQDSEEALQM